MIERGTLKYYRAVAGLSITRLAGLAGVSRDVIIKAEKGETISDMKAFRIVRALNSVLPDDDKIDERNPPISIE